MASIQDLREIYDSFCSFGSNRNLSTGSTSDISAAGNMDNARFAKLCKDCKIIDGKKITTTDVDILFNKCKPKAARRLDWESFQAAFQELADKKFPAKNSHDSYQSLLAHICDKGPIARATIAKTDGIYDKLTNTALYTGTHKNRFDDNGIGRGAEGRVQITGQIAMNKIVNRDTNAAVAHNTFSGPAPTPLQKKRPIGQSTESIVKVVAKKQDHHTSNGSLAQQKPMQKSTSKSSTNISSSNSNISGSKGSVFDRLTNVQGYTGSHKHRFNEDGSGKGVSGRDLPSKGSAPGAYRGGDVKDLSQILRS